MKPVWVKWVDITDARHGKGLTVMWQLGLILSTTYMHDDEVECTVLARLLEGNEWADFTTIPNANILEVRDVCENFLPGSE